MADQTTSWTDEAAFSMAARLERGEVIHHPIAPFPIPKGEELDFLLLQRLANRAHKNIGYDPHTGKVTGFSRTGADQGTRLQSLFADFSREVTTWLSQILAEYARGWQLDRVSYRPEEEATRKLRLTARNDLLHVDAFPSRPTNGARILRVFVNINPTEPRVWITSDPFARLLERYGAQVGLPYGRDPELFERVRNGLLSIFRPDRPRRSEYDAFMLRFHNFLKANEEFQKHSPKRVWYFPPGAVWLAITDTASHAVRSGRFALEHSFFLAPDTLALPEEAPIALLRRASRTTPGKRAA